MSSLTPSLRATRGIETSEDDLTFDVIRAVRTNGTGYFPEERPNTGAACNRTISILQWAPGALRKNGVRGAGDFLE
ncbi:MAG: hypothetical protein F4X92_02655 [Gammaproteobacteria bacterium]|nr:hypothetical protein [Gammaproteobacteria bacterium]